MTKAAGFPHPFHELCGSGTGSASLAAGMGRHPVGVHATEIPDCLSAASKHRLLGYLPCPALGSKQLLVHLWVVHAALSSGNMAWKSQSTPVGDELVS